MDGFIVTDNVVIAEIHGYTGATLPPGQTFLPAGAIPGAAVGQILPDARARKLAALAARRYEAETGGVTVNGSRFHTDRESQAMLGVAITLLNERAARGETNPSTVWKTVDGFLPVGLAELTNIGLAIGAHVEACFAREAELAAQIMAAQDPDAVDISLWPTGN